MWVGGWRGEKDPKGAPGLLLILSFLICKLGQQWSLGRFPSVTQHPQCPHSLRGSLQVLSFLKGCVGHLLSPCSRSYGGVEGPGGNLNPHSLETPGNCYLRRKCRALGRWLLERAEEWGLDSPGGVGAPTSREVLVCYWEDLRVKTPATLQAHSKRCHY